jgi:hypothetical protein
VKKSRAQLESVRIPLRAWLNVPHFYMLCCPMLLSLGPLSSTLEDTQLQNSMSGSPNL